jgi:GTP-binding protein HflX
VPKPEDDLSPATKENISLAELQSTWMARNTGMDVVFISAVTREHADQLRDLLYQRVREIHILRYPYIDPGKDWNTPGNSEEV